MEKGCSRGQLPPVITVLTDHYLQSLNADLRPAHSLLAEAGVGVLGQQPVAVDLGGEREQLHGTAGLIVFLVDPDETDGYQLFDAGPEDEGSQRRVRLDGGLEQLFFRDPLPA